MREFQIVDYSFPAVTFDRLSLSSIWIYCQHFYRADILRRDANLVNLVDVVDEKRALCGIRYLIGMAYLINIFEGSCLAFTGFSSQTTSTTQTINLLSCYVLLVICIIKGACSEIFEKLIFFKTGRYNWSLFQPKHHPWWKKCK